MDEAFARAALYAACEKSPILKQIKINNLNVSELRELVNINSSFQTRYLPILISKFIVKTALQLGVDTFKKDYPTLCDYIKPENIKITVESDEIACLELSTEVGSFKKNNIIFTVAKNIVTGALGLSLDSLEKILNDVGTSKIINSDDADTSNNNLDKIEINTENRIDGNVPSKPVNFPKQFSNSVSRTFDYNDAIEKTNNNTDIIPTATVVDSITIDDTVKSVSTRTSSKKRKSLDENAVNKKFKETENDYSGVRIHEYVKDTLNYTNNVRDEETLSERNVDITDIDNTSSLSITPSHSASQYNDNDSNAFIVDDTNPVAKNVKISTLNENEDFFIDTEEIINDSVVIDDDRDAYADDDYNEIEILSKSSIELLPSRLKKNANPENFMISTERFLSRVGNNSNNNTEDVESFGFD